VTLSCGFVDFFANASLGSREDGSMSAFGHDQVKNIKEKLRGVDQPNQRC
jgi:hypothetical protein